MCQSDTTNAVQTADTLSLREHILYNLQRECQLDTIPIIEISETVSVRHQKNHRNFRDIVH